MKIFLILLNWNGKSDTLFCLKSLTALDYENLSIVVVDNHSTDGSVQEIKKQYPSLTVLENDKNYGFAKGNNIGIKYAVKQKADAVILLNNDTYVDKNFITALVNEAKKSPKTGILGAHILKQNQPSEIDHLGGIWNKKTLTFDLVRHFNTPLDYVTGCAFFIKKEVIETIGYLDEKFFLVWEEVDYCIRAQEAGFFIKPCPNAYVWHKGSSSFFGKPHLMYFWWRNRLLFLQKRGKKPLSSLFFIIIKLFKHTCLSYLHLFFYKIFFMRKKYEKKRICLLSYKASVRGVIDYFLKNFGNCSPSFLKKISSNSKR